MTAFFLFPVFRQPILLAKKRHRKNVFLCLYDSMCLLCTYDPMCLISGAAAYPYADFLTHRFRFLTKKKNSLQSQLA